MSDDGIKPHLNYMQRFEDANAYVHHMTALLSHEHASNRKFYESNTFENVTVNFTSVKRGIEMYDVKNLQPYDATYYEVTARFPVDYLKFVQMRIKIGALMQINNKALDEAQEEIIGTVFEEPTFDNNYVVLLFERNDKINSSKNNCQISVVFSSFLHQQQIEALQRFRDALKDEEARLISRMLHNIIIGKEVYRGGNDKFSLEHIFDIPNFNLLNDSQRAAIVSSLNNDLHLIQGPPGTGKTHTAISLVKHLRKYFPDDRILICAASNSALDHICQNIQLQGIQCLRVASKTRLRKKTPSYDYFLLDNILKSLLLYIYQQCESSGRNLGNSHGYLNIFGELLPKFMRQDFQMLYKEYQKTTSKSFLKFLQIFVGSNKKSLDTRKFSIKKLLVGTGQVICSTLTLASGSLLRNQAFPIVIIEESGQASEIQTLMPLLQKCKKVCMIGDHMQLGPFTKFDELKETNLGISMFQRLIDLGNDSNMLNVQYRMHPFIAQFPNQEFYNGKLLNGVGESQRVTDAYEKIFGGKKPIMFIENFTKEEISPLKSFYNLGEARICLDCVLRALQVGIKPTDIGIVTLYESQRQSLLQMMHNANFDEHTISGIEKAQIISDIDLSNLDSYQGKEKNLLIISLVRSNDRNQIGYLKLTNRMNVMLTRAKYGMIIIGNPTTLSSDAVWKKLIDFYRESGVIVSTEKDKNQDLVEAMKDLKFSNNFAICSQRSQGIDA